MRIGFFIGAGCSLSVQDADGKPLIPEIAGLTKLVKGYLDNDAKLKAVAQTAWDRVAARSIPTPTVEDVLSHIRTLKSLCGKGAKDAIDGFSADLLDELDLTICEQIRNIVSKPLPTSDTPYHVLALDSGYSARQASGDFHHQLRSSLNKLLKSSFPYFTVLAARQCILDLDSMAGDTTLTLGTAW